MFFMLPFAILYDDSNRSLDELREETAIDEGLFFEEFARKLGKAVADLTLAEQACARQALKKEQDLNEEMNVALDNARREIRGKKGATQLIGQYDGKIGDC